MALKLNGKPLSAAVKRPSLDRLIAFLESLPDDELLTTDEVIHKHKICGRDLLLRSARRELRLFPYRHLVPMGTGGGFYAFGNKKAVLAAAAWAKKELGKS